MKIRLLEDFSNQVGLPKINTAWNTASSSKRYTNANDSSIKSIFGDLPTTIASDNYYTRWSNTNYSGRGQSIDMSVGDNFLHVVCVVNYTGYMYQNNGSGNRLDWGMLFDLPVDWTEDRTIISFDYGGGVNTGLGIVERNSTNEHVPVPSTFNPSVSGKIEMVYESGRLKVYQNNLMVLNIVKNKVFGLGRHYDGTYTQSLVTLDFTISNLVAITVPVESPVRRLSNVRIERTYITEDDQGPVDLDDPINSNEPMGTQHRTVSRPVKFTPGTPVTLGEQERILGMESTLSVVSDTAERFTVRVSDGETELSEDVHETDSTLQPRVAVGDYSLGDDPEDYDQVRIELSVEDLDETP